MSHDTKATLEQQRLAERARRQIDAERRLLTDLIASMQEIRTALLSRDIGALDTTMQNRSLELPKGHLDERRAVNCLVAEQLGLAPNSVSLKTVVEFVESISGVSLEEAYLEIKRLRSNIESMNRGNLKVASSLSQLIDRVLHRALGSPPSSTYGRDGEMSRPGPAGLIERNA